MKQVSKMQEVTPTRVKLAKVDLHPPSHVLDRMARNSKPMEASKKIAAAGLALRINENCNRYQAVNVLENLAICVNNLPKKS